MRIDLMDFKTRLASGTVKAHGHDIIRRSSSKIVETIIVWQKLRMDVQSPNNFLVIRWNFGESFTRSKIRDHLKVIVILSTTFMILNWDSEKIFYS